jgi:predicted  nucleic acid-binding Zn-ribbon protein
VKKQIELLAQIQEKDRTLEDLRQQIMEGPKRIQENEQELDGLAHRLEKEKERIEETKKLQRQFEGEVEDGFERIKKSKARLLTIKNNKEYQAVLKEIEETEKIIKDKEDSILGVMEEREEVQHTLNEKAKDLSAIRERVDKEVKSIQAEVDHARKRLSEEEKAREDVAKVVDSGILAKYENLRIARGGIAVSEVINTTCSGCNMNIPPQMYNELQRRDALRFCPNCERIIYWKNGDGKPVEGMSE